MRNETTTLLDWRSISKSAAISAFAIRSASLLLGVLAIYTLCLLPVARQQLDELATAIHAYGVVGVFATSVIALVDLLLRKLARPQTSFELDDMAWYGVAAVLTGLTIPIYGIFKQLVLPAHGFPLDPYLTAIDHALFLGHSPWRLTHAVFGSVGPTAAIDSLYAAWMALMYLFPGLTVALVRSPERRTRLLWCWLMVWMLVGSAAAWLLASAGPIFYESAVGPNPSYAELTARLASLARQAHSMGIPMGEPKIQPLLLSALRSGHYLTVGGVSAMPSVHVTMAALFAIAGFQIGRTMGWIMTGLAVVIWIGSIHLGWHYATDGIVGTAMILGLWRLSAWVVERLAGRAAEPRPA